MLTVFERIHLQATLHTNLAQKWNKRKKYKHKDADWTVCLYTVASQYPLQTLEASLTDQAWNSHRWLVTAFIIFEWEKQFKDVSTMIEYDLFIIIMLEIPRKGVDFEEVFIFHWALTLQYYCCQTWQGIAMPFGLQQHHAKKKKNKYCSSSILAKRYAGC